MVYICGAAYLVFSGIDIADIPLFSLQKIQIIICILLLSAWLSSLFYVLLVDEIAGCTKIVVIGGAIEITLLCLCGLEIFGFIHLFESPKHLVQICYELSRVITCILLPLGIFAKSYRNNKKKIHIFLRQSILILIGGCMFVLMLVKGMDDIGRNNKFSVVIEDDNPYVIVQTIEDNILMLGCELNEDRTAVVEIFKQKHKIVSAEGLEYEIMTYTPRTEEVPTEPTEIESTTDEPTE